YVPRNRPGAWQRRCVALRWHRSSPLASVESRPAPLAAAALAVVFLVALERAGHRELAELVPDHRLGDEHRHVLAPVVHGDRVSDHLREDRRGPGPGADHPLVAGGVHGLDPGQQPLLDERPLLARATHRFLPLLRPRTMYW